MSKKQSVRKAINAISSGDARGLRNHINEALVEKVRKALDKKEKQIAKKLIEASTSSLQEAIVEKGSKTSISFPKATCVVIGDGDEGFDDFTKKKVTSGVRPGTKFSASSTGDVLAKLKCDKHMIQTDQLKKIKDGAKTLYVFVDPFHAQNNEDRVVQIFADERTAKEWYEESVNVGSEPHIGSDIGEPIFR